MIDNTTPTDAVSPDEMAQILARLHRGVAPETQPTPDTEIDERLKPRSVKMSDQLDLRVQVRAAELGMTKSAYFRWLAERDLENAYSAELEMVPLEQAREIATRAVGEALGRLSHRPGHAA